jgi:hypothetical protein
MLKERPRSLDPDPAGDVRSREVVVRVDQGRRGTGVGLAAAVVLLVAALVVAGAALLWNSGFGLGDIFGTTTIDRSAPVLVQRLHDRAEFRGASGTFSATVDLETKHGPIPTFIAGSHTIYTGVGDVDATVSLRHLAPAATRPDGTVVLTLPHAALGAARLDPRLSHVNSRDRGLADRVGGIFSDSPTSERGVQRVALRRIERAAAASGLRAKAERNTARMVRDLARAVGVEHVVVQYADPAAPARH